MNRLTLRLALLAGLLTAGLAIGLQLSILRGQDRPAAATRPATAMAAPSPYGVNNWYWYGEPPRYQGTRNTFADLDDLGARWARVLGFWNFVEGRQGDLQWDAGGAFQGWVDKWVNNCAAHGTKISFCIVDPPGWCRDKATGLPSPESTANFIREAMRRYKGKIAAVECFNEDTTGTWPRVASRSVAFYAPIQKAVYRAVKAEDPAIPVTMAGIWANPMYYLEDMYKEGLKDYFDAANFHFYTSSSVDHGDPRYLDCFRGDLAFMVRYFIHVMDKYGDTKKPIWVTEIGWDNDEPKGVGEDRQAEYLTASWDVFRRSGRVERVFWYVLDGNWMGLTEGEKKYKVYQAYKDYAAKYPTWPTNPSDPLPPAPPPGERELVIPNPGFEEGLTGFALAEEFAPCLKVVSDGPHGGGQCLMLDNTTAGPEGTGEKPVEVVGPAVPVEPGRVYELRGWMKMTGGGPNAEYAHAMIDIEFLGADRKPLNLRGPLNGAYGKDKSTNYYVSETGGKWYEVHYPMITSKETRFVRIIPNINYKRGAACFDDIRVIPLDVNTPQKP